MKRLCDFMAGAKGLTLVGLLASAFLVACDGSGNGAEAADVPETDITETAYDDLPVCINSREGSTAYVKGEKKAYVCENGDWVVVSGSEESSVESSDTSSAELNCSAILDGRTGWDWDVPKECRFNPDIKYGTMTDGRDKKVYRTIKIGKQTWMAENLNYADSTKTPSLLNRSWCYDDVAENCAVTGRLYTWAAAIDSAKLYKDKSIDCGDRKICTLPAKVRGVCPDGWHLPTYTEWNTLLTEVGGSLTAGKILKSQTGWRSCSRDGDRSNANGTDSVGFSALPASYRSDLGDFRFVVTGCLTRFWSATNEESVERGAYHMVVSDIDGAALGGYSKSYALSVRCVKDY